MVRGSFGWKQKGKCFRNRDEKVFRNRKGKVLVTEMERF